MADVAKQTDQRVPGSDQADTPRLDEPRKPGGRIDYRGFFACQRQSQPAAIHARPSRGIHRVRSIHRPIVADIPAP